MIVECKYTIINHQMCIFGIENFVSFKELFKKMEFGLKSWIFKLYKGDYYMIAAFHS